MKIKYSLSLLLIVLALAASGCAASARVGNVSTDRPSDIHVALISKEAK